jgi:hypothetical protein
VVTFKKVNTNEEKTKLATIKVAEVTHSAFYAPLYVAIEKGYFRENGLDVELILTPGADKVSAAVLSNDVDSLCHRVWAVNQGIKLNNVAITAISTMHFIEKSVLGVIMTDAFDRSNFSKTINKSSVRIDIRVMG